METAKKILLIGDDSMISSSLSYALFEKGYKVIACMLLRDAVGLLNSNTFDLIISDIGLPDGNSLDFCSIYRQTPFIAMSASDCSEMAIANGAKSFIEKPFTSNKIKAVKQSTFKTGKYIGCCAPFGYLKDPNDHHKLIVDEKTAPIVKHIFGLWFRHAVSAGNA